MVPFLTVGALDPFFTIHLCLNATVKVDLLAKVTVLVSFKQLSTIGAEMYVVGANLAPGPALRFLTKWLLLGILAVRIVALLDSLFRHWINARLVGIYDASWDGRTMIYLGIQFFNRFFCATWCLLSGRDFCVVGCTMATLIVNDLWLVVQLLMLSLTNHSFISVALFARVNNLLWVLWYSLTSHVDLFLALDSLGMHRRASTLVKWLLQRICFISIDVIDQHWILSRSLRRWLSCKELGLPHEHNGAFLHLIDVPLVHFENHLLHFLVHECFGNWITLSRICARHRLILFFIDDLRSHRRSCLPLSVLFRLIYDCSTLSLACECLFTCQFTLVGSCNSLTSVALLCRSSTLLSISFSRSHLLFWALLGA